MKPRAFSWGACALATAFLLGGCGREGPEATWNGRPLAGEELAWAREVERAGVIQYFHDRYGAADSPGYWTTRWGGPAGEIPSVMLWARMMERLRRCEAQRDVARRYGVPTWDAASLHRDFLAENDGRKARSERAEPVYGPPALREADYLEYRLRNMELETKARMAADPRETLDPLLREYWTAHADEFTPPDQVAVRLWTANSLSDIAAVLHLHFDAFKDKKLNTVHGDVSQQQEVIRDSNSNKIKKLEAALQDFFH